MATPARSPGADPSPSGAGRARRDSIPAVVAVVVTEGAVELERTLECLAAQDYRALTVLVIDRGRPSGREERRARIARVAPGALVRQLDRHPDAVSAANDVVTSVEGAPFVCFVADDVEPEPSAIRLLVEEAIRSNAAICGPKIVDRDDPEVLVEVGLAIDHYGVALTGIEPGERDQEQHDAVRDSFFVSTAMLLVRADLLRDLGGFDLGCAPGNEDLDLCWRARVAGARVMVVPDARARRDPSRARRFGTATDEIRAATRSRARTLMKNYSVGALVWVLPIASVLNTMEVFGFLLSRRATAARGAFVGWWSTLLRFTALREERAAVQRIRKVDDRDVRAFMVRGSARLRVLAARRRHRGTIVGTAESRLRQRAERWRAALRSVDVWLALVVGALLLFGARGVFVDGVAPTRGFQTWTGVGDLLGAWGGRWRATGLGAPDPGTPLSGLAGVWSALWFGHAAWAQALVVAGAAPLGLVGVYRLTRRLSSRALPAAVSVLAYGANPIVRNAFVGARLDALVVIALAPFVLGRLIVLVDGASGAARRRAWAGLVVLLAIGGSAAPAFVLFPLLVAVAITVAAPVVSGLREIARSWVAAVIGAVGAFIALSPWSFTAIGDAGSLGLTARRHPSFLSVLAFRTGVAGAGPWVWFLYAAAVLPLLVASERRFAWAVRAWVLVIGSLGTVAWTSRALDTASPALEVLLVPAALGLALAIGIGLSAFFGDIRAFVFGPRQVVALALAAASVLPIVGVVPDTFDGSFDAPTESWSETLAFFGLVAHDDGPFRVAWIGTAESLPVDSQGSVDQFAFAVTRNGSGDARDLLPPGPGAPEATLEHALELARDGRTARLGHALAPLGVRYVALVDRPAPDSALRYEFDTELAGQLDVQLDLSLARRVDGIALYENEAWMSPRALLPADDLPDGASGELGPSEAAVVATRTEAGEIATTVRGPDSALEVPSSGRLHVAERYDDAWTATSDGRRLDKVVSFGWANGFDAPAGKVALSVDRGGLGTARLLVPILVWPALLVAAMWRRRGEAMVRALAVESIEPAPRPIRLRRRPRSRAADPAGTTMQAEADAAEDGEDLEGLAALAELPVEPDDVDWSVLAPDLEPAELGDELDESENGGRP